ncbi:MAG: hypothetical protein GXY75_00215 [Bacteroidales bacterium]|jgi:predicted small secreted protein|nr:hypothetical protein [Bacteroidales bacterium]
MKKLLSLVVLSIILASCNAIEDIGLLEDIKTEYALYDHWRGSIHYKIYSEDNDFLIKTLIFSEDCTKCTVYTGISFINCIDEENLIVRVSGENQLILMEEDSYKELYKLKFTKGIFNSFEMNWKRHTKLEIDHIPDRLLSVTMNRVIVN